MQRRCMCSLAHAVQRDVSLLPLHGAHSYLCAASVGGALAATDVNKALRLLQVLCKVGVLCALATPYGL